MGNLSNSDNPDPVDNQREDHLSEDSHTHQDHHRKDNRGNKDNPVISVQIPKVNNKRKHNSDIKLITIKPPTKEQMKIKRRKKSVVATPPDKNQRKITSMLGTEQKVGKVE